MKINTVLFTKDGRRVGNAIVVEFDGEFYKCITDYGTKITLNINEVYELFYVDDDYSRECQEHFKYDHKHAVEIKGE